MRLGLLVIGLAVVSAVSASGHWGEKEEEDVVILTEANFDSFIEKHDKVFVEFYAPWCGHCKNLAPKYSALARRTKAEEKGIPVAKIDATENADLAQKYGITGYPSLKLFSKGEPIDYKGAREEEPMFKWLKSRSEPRAKLIENVSELDQLERHKIAVLYILPEDDVASLEKFEAVAASFENVPFHYTHSDEARDKYDADEKYVFVLYRNFDDGKKFLMNKEPFNTASMKGFFNSLRYPMVMDFDQETAERIFEQRLPTFVLFTDKNREEPAKLLKEMAQSNLNAVVFAISTISTDFGKKLSEFVGISEKDDGAVRILEFENGSVNKYACNGNEKSAFEECISNFKNKKLDKLFKSEDLPDNSSEDLKVVVGKNFKELVHDKNKHVLLEIYAPWCGHCKAIAPIYEELAKKLANHPEILITKMDGTANEVEGLQIRGFPTIQLYKKDGKNEPVDFQGERTLAGFIEFLEKETGLKLNTEGDALSGDL